MQIRSVSVLGAGTMGAQIAAHFANAGVPVLLLDVTRDQARAGFEKSRALKPDPLFTGSTHTLVRTGGFDEDLPAIAGSDWVIEAIVERLDIKRALLARVEQHRAPHAIVSSNTFPMCHIGNPDCLPFGRPIAPVSRRVARHALLQPAALPASARADSDS
jgi:3-hydroxyacyl-CoA dehydrogenase